MGNSIAAVGATDLALLLGDHPQLKLIDLNLNRLDAPAQMYMSDLQRSGYKRPRLAPAAALPAPEEDLKLHPAAPTVPRTEGKDAARPSTAPAAGSDVPRLRLGVAQADDFASQRVLMQVSKEAAALPLGWLEGALLALILLFGWLCYAAALPALVFQSLYQTIFTSQYDKESRAGPSRDRT